MTCKARVTADCFCHCPGSVCLYMTLCDSLCLNMTLCHSLWFSVTQYTSVWLFMILRYPLWLQPTAYTNWYSAIGTQQLLQDEMDWIDEVCYTLLDGVKSVSCQLRATERFWDWPGICVECLICLVSAIYSSLYGTNTNSEKWQSYKNVAQ